MRARLPPAKAGTHEIRRQIVEQKDLFFRGIDVIVLWYLHTHLGFGKLRLERAYHEIIELYLDMCNFFETEKTFPAEIKLSEIGINIDELRDGVKSK